MRDKLAFWEFLAFAVFFIVCIIMVADYSRQMALVLESVAAWAAQGGVK